MQTLLEGIILKNIIGLYLGANLIDNSKPVAYDSVRTTIVILIESIF